MAELSEGVMRSVINAVVAIEPEAKAMVMTSFPLRSTRDNEAPASRSSLQRDRWPRDAARCRRVRPSPSEASGFPPADRNLAIVGSTPEMAAIRTRDGRLMFLLLGLSAPCSAPPIPVPTSQLAHEQRGAMLWGLRSMLLSHSFVSRKLVKTLSKIAGRFSHRFEGGTSV